MKSILVAGGAGFVGSHLCKRLLSEGNKVICLDNFSTGSKENVLPFSENPSFRLVEHDVVHPFNVEVDEIYNLACPASPVQYTRDPVKTMKTCVLGAMNLLSLAHKNHATILQASTSEVYGAAEVHPQKETYWGNVNPVGPRSCYEEGKRCAESLFMDYHNQYGIKIKIVRIFNTYGPGMSADDGRVVPSFILQALRGERLTIFGNGKQNRSFQYIDDLIEGLLRMMATPTSFTGPVNIGNRTNYTMNELARIILDITGSPSKMIYRTLPQNTPRDRQPDVSLANYHLNGWEASVDLKQGLSRSLPYFIGLHSLLHHPKHKAS